MALAFYQHRDLLSDVYSTFNPSKANFEVKHVMCGGAPSHYRLSGFSVKKTFQGF